MSNTIKNFLNNHLNLTYVKANRSTISQGRDRSAPINSEYTEKVFNNDLVADVFKYLDVDSCRNLRLTQKYTTSPYFFPHLKFTPDSPSLTTWHNNQFEISKIEQAWIQRECVKLPSDLTDEMLLGLINKGHLKSVKQLDLSNCSALSAAALEGLSALGQLQSLTLNGCKQFSAEALTNLAALNTLECLGNSKF